MSKIAVTCPGCSTALEFAPTLAGRNVRCRVCQAGVAVPEVPLPTAEPAPARPAAAKAQIADDDEPDDDRPSRKNASPPPRGNSYRIPLLLLLGCYIPFLIGVCLLSGGTALALLWYAVADRADGGPSLAGIAAGVGGVVLGLVSLHILFGAVALFQKTDETDPLEIELPDQWQEGLSELIDRVAEEQELYAPDVVRLHAASIAHVYQDRKGQAVLVIGGLAVAALSERALAGVIAHELAHFTAGDTALSRAAARWHRVMARLDILFLTRAWVRWNPLAWVFRGYHLLYAAVWFAHQRAAEYAADRQEIAHVGKEKAAATLVLLEVLERMEWTNLVSVAEAFVETNQRLDTLFAEQVRRVRTAGPTEWTDALKKALRHDRRWYDTHPALEERLGAIGVKPKKALKLAYELATDPGARPGTALFANWPVVEKYLTKKVVNIVREYLHARREFTETVAAIERAVERANRGG